MNNLLSDVEIHRHVRKREVKEQNHVNKRNAQDGDDKVTLIVFLIRSSHLYPFKLILPNIHTLKTMKLF